MFAEEGGRSETLHRIGGTEIYRLGEMQQGRIAEAMHRISRDIPFTVWISYLQLLSEALNKSEKLVNFSFWHFPALPSSRVRKFAVSLSLSLFMSYYVRPQVPGYELRTQERPQVYKEIVNRESFTCFPLDKVVTKESLCCIHNDDDAELA
eukprot:764163-Hanusia_phi.AAC.1